MSRDLVQELSQALTDLRAAVELDCSADTSHAISIIDRCADGLSKRPGNLSRLDHAFYTRLPELLLGCDESVSAAYMDAADRFRRCVSSFAR